jgi:pimeloyl-ACP methyl ester carboxylesterase
MRLTLTQNAERLAGFAGGLGCKVHLVGHSMGALVALEAARRLQSAIRRDARPQHRRVDLWVSQGAA